MCFELLAIYYIRRRKTVKIFLYNIFVEPKPDSTSETIRGHGYEIQIIKINGKNPHGINRTEVYNQMWNLEIPGNLALDPSSSSILRS